MTKKSISKILGLLLVVGLLFAALPTGQAQAATTYTVCPGGSCNYTTIQAAIDAAADGNVIEVGPGTYNENITIDVPNLTLRSTGGAANTIINATIGIGVSILKDLGIVTVDGFTVKGWLDGGIIQATANRPGTTARILNNIVIGVNAGTTDHGNGIQVTGDNSLVEGNTVSGAYYSGTGTYGATGILVYAANNAIVRNNTVSNADLGIGVWAGGYHSLGPITGVLVEGNEVFDSETGISVGFDANDTSIKDNYVHDNETGLYEDYYLGLGPTGTIALHNRIVDNTDQAYTGSSDATTIPAGHIFMAEANWWGSIAGPSETEINEYVDFTPWCANAECTEFLPAAVTIAPVDPVVCGNTPTSTIDIMVAGIPTATPLQGYQFRLNFDETKTNVAILATDIVNGDFLVDGGYLVTRWLNADGSASTTPTGILEVGYTQFGQSTSIGSGELASITLTHLGVPGDIELTLSDLVLSDRDGFPIPGEVSTVPVILTLNPAVKNITKNLGYCGLAAAVAAADSGNELQLLADITIPATVTVDKALTLDLNGKVATYLTAVNSYALTVDGTVAALTVKDSLTGGKIKVVNTSAAIAGRGINVLNGGSLIFNSGAIEAPYSSVYVRANSSMVLNGGTLGGYYGVVLLGNDTVNSVSLTVNGGTISSEGIAISGNGTTGFGGTTITINDGTITSAITAIFHPQIGALNISGGTITGPNPIEMKAGNLTVSGGTISATGAYVALPEKTGNGSTINGNAIFIYNRDGYGTGQLMNVTVTGGTITSTNGYALREFTHPDETSRLGVATITGGHFTGGTPGAVSFTTNNATNLELTGGDYSTDPIAFVYTPYFTYLSGGRWYIAIPPSITSTDIQGYYLTGEAREFHVTVDNPSGGGNYAHVIFQFNITADAGDLSLEYWNGTTFLPLPLTCASGVCSGYYGPATGFPMANPYTATTTFRLTAAVPDSYPVEIKLLDLDAASAVLASYTNTASVYDKPTVTYTSDPYFIIGEPGNFAVTITNPATGKNYANTAVFDVVLQNHVVDDITAISCTDGTTTWNLLSSLTPDGANVKARIGGLDGFLTIPAPLTATIPCTVTYATAGTYTTSTSMVDVVSPLPDRVVSADIPGTAIVYAKPVITATNLAGPFDAGVAETVTLSIANTSIPGPFEIVFDYPVGTIIYLGSEWKMCYTGTGCAPFVLSSLPNEPTVLNFSVNVPVPGTFGVGVNLFDSDWLPTDRLLASATASLQVNGNFIVTGNFSMQGNLSRAGIPVTFTWGGTFASYAPTGTSTAASGTNFSLTLTYGGNYTITTNQPRYLNVTDASGKTFLVNGDKTLNPLRLFGGDADQDNKIGVNDASMIGTAWGSTLNPEANINYDGIVNIQDLALVGGNFGLISATAYSGWLLP